MRFGFWEILLIVFLVLLLFGAKKIPEFARNLAEGIRAFKETEEKKPVKKTTKKKSK